MRQAYILMIFQFLHSAMCYILYENGPPWMPTLLVSDKNHFMENNSLSWLINISYLKEMLSSFDALPSHSLRSFQCDDTGALYLLWIAHKITNYLFIEIATKWKWTWPSSNRTTKATNDNYVNAKKMSIKKENNGKGF